MDDGICGTRNIVATKGTRVVVLMSAYNMTVSCLRVTLAVMSVSSLPPGLTRNSQLEYIETSSGGDCDWLTFTSTRLYTNSFIFSPGPPQKVILLEPSLTSYTQIRVDIDSPRIQEARFRCRLVSLRVLT